MMGDSMERGLTRRDFLKLSGTGLAGVTLLGGAAGGGHSGSIREAFAAAQPGTTNCSVGEPWVNYPRTKNITPYRTCTPESLADVVATVREAEAANKRVHAFGSRWSFSDCALTSDYLIDTKHLNRPLQTVRHALRPGQSPLLYHVEAGITIRDLYNSLDQRGLALETMGGAAGQTLAGAISTGTHGGDKFMAPLADSVLAIHLVGAGGTQYWIEPSPGITNRALLKARVVPDVNRRNIIYDDATFDACLVSLGCMGVIYAVVLRVRERYDLVETTVETTWQAFKYGASAYLNDPNNRYLQIMLNPYTDSNNDNYCLLTTRSEDCFTEARKRPDYAPAVKAAVEVMVRHMQFLRVDTLLILGHHGVLDDAGLSEEERLAKLVQGILTYTPYHRPVLIAHYANILRARFPPGTFRGSSYSVMDVGYVKEGEEVPSYQRGFSIELHFQSMEFQDLQLVGDFMGLGRDQVLFINRSGGGGRVMIADFSGGQPPAQVRYWENWGQSPLLDGWHDVKRLPFVDFVDAVIGAVNAATQTFFAGYVSVRFTGATRAYLGMQQWNQTCTVEISTVQDVQGLPELLTELFKRGFNLGGLPHWGQQLDLGVQGHGSLYRQYAEWRRVYAKMSKNFTARTFENELSSGWNLTTPNQGPVPRRGRSRSSGVQLEPGGGTYVVQPGDTLSELALQLRTTVEHLAAVNGIQNPDLIYTGQTLYY
jgi:hypothetical protein